MATKKFLDVAGLSTYSQKVKKYVDDKVSGLDLSLYVIVTDDLPTTNINKNKIYLKAAGVTGNQNKYAEYVYTGDTSAEYDASKWEKLGEMQTSITVDGTVTAGSKNPVSGGAVSTALANKVDKVSGKGLSTNDYTTAEKNKLAGIAEGANNYSLPTASASAKGGITLGYTANGKNYPVALDTNGKAYVNVPWTDTDTTYDLTPYAKTADVDTALAKKVDAVTGKGLSTNDYTTAEKEKLAGLTKITVDTALCSTSTNPVQNKAVNTALGNKVDTSTYNTKMSALDSSIAGKMPNSAATSSALGGIKIGHTADGAELPLVLDTNNAAYVSVEVMTDDDITAAFNA